MVEKMAEQEEGNQNSLLDKDSQSLGMDDKSKTMDSSTKRKEGDSGEGNKNKDHSPKEGSEVDTQSKGDRSETKAGDVRTERSDNFEKTSSSDRKAGERIDKYSKERTGYSRDKPYIKKRFVLRKRECYFTKNKINYIDYKDVDLLKRFIGRNGRILPRRFTGTSLLFQRKLSKAIKRARVISLLPYVGEIEYTRPFSSPSEAERPREREKEISHGEKM